MTPPTRGPAGEREREDEWKVGEWDKKADEVSRGCNHSVEEGLYACTPCIAKALLAREAAQEREIERLKQENAELSKLLQPHVHDINKLSCGCCGSCECGYGYGGTHLSAQEKKA